MSKEYLKALERLAMPDELHIKECEKLGIGLTEDYNMLKQYFESIENAKPSEAMKNLEILYDEIHPLDNIGILDIHFDTIKNYILKSQEQEKVLEIIKKKKINIDLLYASSSVEQYNDELVILYGMWFVKDRQLTEEEFDLLKRWVE